MPGDPIPLACVPGAIPLAERAAHRRLLAELFSAVQEKTPLADGYGYRFDAGRLADVARWLENERRCCPFLSFSVELRITGPDGTPAFLDAEYPRVG